MSIIDVANLGKKIFLIVLLVSSILFSYRLLYGILGFGKRITFKKAKKNNKFIILIPARNESKVIGELLSALKNQTYPQDKFETIVIVKDKEDKTIDICQQFGFKCLVEPNQKCKGDALDSAIKYIYKNNILYDALLIFDADNIPTKTFLTEMNKALDAGFDIGMGYRNSKNWNDGWVATASGLTFSIINTLSNKGRTKLGLNNIFSGTGYFIRESVIAPYKAWIFKTLTEDYEISMYATLKNLKTTYVETAEYFDEQPVSFNASVDQRTRWIKGFMSARKIYSHKIFKSIFTTKSNKFSKFEQSIGVTPLVFIVVDTILYLLLQIVLAVWAMIAGLKFAVYWETFFKVILITFVVLQAITFTMILAENNRTNMNLKTKLSILFTNPIFIASYIIPGIKAVFGKNVGWKQIEHNKKLDVQTDEIEQTENEVEENTKKI